jgi:Zn-dependent protease with chaperone function
MGFAGILNNPKSPVTNGFFSGSELVAPDQGKTDLLLGHAIRLGPELAVQVSLEVIPEIQDSQASGVITVDLERYGISTPPSKQRKEIIFDIEPHEILKHNLDFYVLEKNYFELTMWEPSGSDAIRVDWHVQVVSVDFGVSTASPLLIICGSLMSIEALRLRRVVSPGRVRVMAHVMSIFVILGGILVLPANEFARLSYYFSLAQRSIGALEVLEVVGVLAILALPLVVYLLTPRIIKKRYKVKRLENDHSIAVFLSQKFGRLDLYLFESNRPNAYLLGICENRPEIGISTALVKEFQNGSLDEADLINIISHEIGHIMNLDLVFWNFGRLLLGSYKYWIALYAVTFWVSQLVVVNPYGWVAPIAYIFSSEFWADLFAGIRFFIMGDFVAAKVVFPPLDIDVFGMFLSTLAVSFILPYFLLSSAFHDGELAADRVACEYFTSKESMRETIMKILKARLRQLGLMAFWQGLSLSARVKNLESTPLAPNPNSAIRNGLAVGVLSYVVFMRFDLPFLTLFLLPLFLIATCQWICYYSSIAGIGDAVAFGQVGANLRKMGLESVLGGIAFLVAPLAALSIGGEYRQFSWLLGALAIGVVYVPLASFALSGLFLAIKLVELKLERQRKARESIWVRSR